ncbi:GAF domain-containing protein [Paracoccus sp. PAMC 22219]|uniref:GAF domain-containing protein n=1 Tax=Paracoccus sp. PAMC 22219 TaxID=1569209 RepID=UPI0018CE3718|nr:GAF domain-containing protein [Paracoccus sp. PAMC 22219]
MNEADRLDALHAYGILDTASEVGFDDIVRLATRLCDTPVALISLVDADRQWFKARVGFEPCETPIEQSVCKHVFGQHDLLVISDLTLDVRTRSNPLVLDDPHLRFYAGAPLVTPKGLVLGTICVIDHVARPGGLTDVQADDLRALARQIMTLLEMRQLIASRDDMLLDAESHRKKSEHEHLELSAMFEQTPSFMALLKGPNHVFKLVNPAYCRLVGNRQLIGKSVAEALPDAAEQGYMNLLDEAYRSGRSFTQTGARYAIQADPHSPVDERFVDFVCQPTRNEKGIVTGIFVEVRMSQSMSAKPDARRLLPISASSCAICLMPMTSQALPQSAWPKPSAAAVSVLERSIWSTKRSRFRWIGAAPLASAWSDPTTSDHSAPMLRI